MKAPYLNFNETDYNPFLNGSGGEVAIFIGKTSNTTKANTLLKFKNYKTANKTVESGGLGVENNNTPNPLLNVLKDFFIESSKTSTTDIGVNHVYAIDMGENPTIEDWITALNITSKKRDITLLAFVGITDISFMYTVESFIKNLTSTGDLRIAYFQIPGDDSTLIKYTDPKQETYIQKSRIYLVEEEYFGRTIANIALTPYYEEPGYSYYRSIEPGTFKERSIEEEDALFSAGIIFNRDEVCINPIKPCICCGVSTAFSIEESEERPNDSLLHARRNADHQIRELFKIISPQLKRNETETNLRYIKSDCETYLENEYNNGYIHKDFEINVIESQINPFSLFITGKIVPVNSTLAIDVSCYIGEADLTVAEEIT